MQILRTELMTLRCSSLRKRNKSKTGSFEFRVFPCTLNVPQLLHLERKFSETLQPDFFL